MSFFFVIRFKFGVLSFSNHEKARQKGLSKNAHPGSHYDFKSILLTNSNNYENYYKRNELS